MRRSLPAMAVIVLLALCGCSSPAPVARTPVLLFAVDGMEWSVISPLLARGEMPVLAGLMDRGAYGYLDTMRPTQSPVIWTSIATGKPPDEHGIKGFVFKDDPEGGREAFRTYTSGHRKTKAFWNILDDYDRSTNVIGWWITYPAEPVRGVMVSQTNTTSALRDPQGDRIWKGGLLEGVDGQVHPPERQAEVLAVLDEVDRSLPEITAEIFGKWPYPLDEFAELVWSQTQWSFRADATYVRVARDLLAEGEPADLTAIYLGGLDVAGHRFWRYAYPDEFKNPPAPEQVENFGDVIEDYYRYADRVLGDLLALLPQDVTVLVVSDHGMHSVHRARTFRTSDEPSERNSGDHQDAPPGVLIAAGPLVRSSGGSPAGGEIDLRALPTVGTVLDVTPTILMLQGVPLGRDMSGRPMKAVLDQEQFGTFAGWVETHDDPDWLARRDGRKLDAVDQNERIEQLRALGYVQ